MVLLLCWALLPLDIVVPADARLPIAVRATTATSERGRGDSGDLARHAFDGDDYPGVFTRWCSAPGRGAGEALTLTFDGVEAVDHLTLRVDPKAARVLLVGAEPGVTVTVRPDAAGYVDARIAARARALRIGVVEAEVAGGASVCLNDVTIIRGAERVPLVFGVPTTAARRVAADAAAIDAALATCDAAALAGVAAFPVGYDYVGPGDAGAHGQLADGAALAARCRTPGLGRLDGDPLAGLRTVGDDARASLAASDGRRFLLTWRDGRWRLAAVKGAGRVRH